MIRSELVAALAEENPHLMLKDVERIVSIVFDDMVVALARGHRIELRGFGTFSVKKRNACICRNPKTGEQVEVAAKNIPAFRSGKELKNRINK
ncbi:integration host factor subunit beta [Entomobacter blattae]|uniref:Integration host factor subunit beta n=1 Tax=Entomobacter blattae TaxID=2762277 RepID=A0A7H1NNM2_9PROT|nr:integration host factor subunit beta [Entomobacter blattae]QNT77382.1 Integration host factor subunit beta [Entomobacter blattae]